MSWPVIGASSATSSEFEAYDPNIPAHILDDAIGLWQLDEETGATRRDSVNSYHLANYGGDAEQGTAPSPFVLSLHTYLGSPTLGIADAAGIRFDSDQDFGVQCWVCPAETTDVQMICGKSYTGEHEWALEYINLKNWDRFRWRVGDFSTTGGTVHWLLPSQDYVSENPGLIYHLLAEYDASEGLLRLYVNNSLEDSFGDSAEGVVTSAAVVPSAAGLGIGAWLSSTDQRAKNFRGNIWSVLLRRGTFSAYERDWLYNDGTGRYLPPTLPSAATTWPEVT